MKVFIKRIVVLMLVAAPFVGILAQNETIEAINKTLKAASGDELSAYCAETVTISLFDKEVQVPKAKAIALMNNFFVEHPVKSFVTKHSGKSKDGTNFTIGQYDSQNGEQLRTYFVVRSNKITEICIEEE